MKLIKSKVIEEISNMSHEGFMLNIGRLWVELLSEPAIEIDAPEKEETK